MDNIKLLQAMQKIVDTSVEHYKSDFIIDIDYFYTTKDASFVWITRKCGTNICRINPAENTKDVELTKAAAKRILQYYLALDNEDKKNRFFLISKNDGNIKELSYEDAFNIAS